jgi:hypothetical protein
VRSAVFSLFVTVVDVNKFQRTQVVDFGDMPLCILVDMCCEHHNFDTHCHEILKSHIFKRYCTISILFYL